MNSARQIFGTHYGSNRPVSPRQRALLARINLGRGHVTVPPVAWPDTDATQEVISALPRFVVDFNGERPAGLTVNVRGGGAVEPLLTAAA
jgi:hypothetical protein